MKDVNKLTVLDFKKEQLVNLNDEEMSAVKGGLSSIGCSIASVAFSYVYGKDASWWRCKKDTPPEPDFYISKIQYPEITCASIEPIVIEAY